MFGLGIEFSIGTGFSMNNIIFMPVKLNNTFHYCNAKVWYHFELKSKRINKIKQIMRIWWKGD